jgi:hypothetical protein
MPEALSDAGSAGGRGKSNFFFLNVLIQYNFEPPKQKGTYACVNSVNEYKEAARAPCYNTGRSSYSRCPGPYRRRHAGIWPW